MAEGTVSPASQSFPSATDNLTSPIYSFCMDWPWARFSFLAVSAFLSIVCETQNIFRREIVTKNDSFLDVQLTHSVLQGDQMQGTSMEVLDRCGVQERDTCGQVETSRPSGERIRWWVITAPMLVTFGVCHKTLAQSDPGRWTGKWIWMEGNPKPYHFFLMTRGSVLLEAKPASARLLVTAADRYLLDVNGQYLAGVPPEATHFGSLTTATMWLRTCGPARTSLRFSPTTTAARAGARGTPAPVCSYSWT